MNHEHCYRHRREMAVARAEAKKAAEIETAYLECQNGCVGENKDKITIHTHIKDYSYKCDDCGHEREAQTSSINAGESSALRRRVRQCVSV
jgi:hypothetical protein